MAMEATRAENRDISEGESLRPASPAEAQPQRADRSNVLQKLRELQWTVTSSRTHDKPHLQILLQFRPGLSLPDFVLHTYIPQAHGDSSEKITDLHNAISKISELSALSADQPRKAFATDRSIIVDLIKKARIPLKSSVQRNIVNAPW